eukprot:GFKZ01015908.1.p1 GENE.GFKZ01015908.1~~GFKZ01015908.1.p1  ORF type:complete len:708 (-),score=71.12 GFKZ01015908.1:1044-3167(-)
MPALGPEPVEGPRLEEDFARKREEMQRVAKDCIVVINNIPKAKPEKFNKLNAVLSPLFEKSAEVRRDEHGNPRVTIVKGEDGSSMGFGFVEYVTPEEAHKALSQLHNYQLDKVHRFWACTAGDLQRLQDMSDEFVPPSAIPVASNRPNFKSWLLDERGRDQFLIRHEDETSIFWHDHVVKPVVDYTRLKWTEGGAVWSPRGTYIATFHPRGIQLWGRVPPENTDDAVEWKLVMRFEHTNVTLLDFSPCENYLITFNGTEPERDDKRNPRALVVWDILTGRRKRGFVGPPRSILGPDGNIPWPIFLWSHDDKYFARLNENAISVYQTPDMGLLDKKSIKLPHVRNFAWSPTDNIMAYWTPEVNDAPARVSLIELPSKREIRQKALFSVSSIVLHWQQEGRFLCCKVDRLTKSKKGQFTNFELFRVKAKDVPVEVLEYKERDIVNAFAWEPHGNRFAVIHAYSDVPGKTDVSFFTMEGLSGELKPLFTLEKKSANQLHWSPKGRFILLAAVCTQNGSLEWFDVNEVASKNVPEAIGSDEHFACNQVQWDPSGRFVTTAVTCWRSNSDNGYIIWTLYGKELCRVNVDQLYQFNWRPRPPSLLSAKQEREVKKNLKTRKERYEREDKDLKDTVSSGKAAKRKEQRDAYYAFQKRVKEVLEKEADKRTLAIACYGTDHDDTETIVEVVETIISVKTEIDFSKKLLTSDDERD